MRLTSAPLAVVGVAAFCFAACGGSTDAGSSGNRNGVGLCADCGDDPSVPNEDAGGGDDQNPPPAPTPTLNPNPAPPPTPGVDGIALRHRDFPPPSSGSSGSSGGSGGSGGVYIDPDTLHIAFGTAPTACDDPFAASACGQWRVALNVPPELLAPGVLDLSDPRLNAFSSASGADRGGGDCSWGGGSFVQGTIEIVSIGADSIELRLADTWAFDFDADGAHIVAICR